MLLTRGLHAQAIELLNAHWTERVNTGLSPLYWFLHSLHGCWAFRDHMEAWKWFFKLSLSKMGRDIQIGSVRNSQAQITGARLGFGQVIDVALQICWIL